MVDLTPTSRAVVDVGRKCNVNCRFCYYKHLGDLRKEEFHSKEKLKEEIDFAAARGNDYIDFTGGEPTIHPDICELVSYCRDTYNMGVCIITNALVGEKKISELINTGVDDFLVSIHGLQATHNFLTSNNHARTKQVHFLCHLRDRKDITLRFNLVMNKFNQDELYDTANWCTRYNPTIVNLINFNPHHEWSVQQEDTQKILPDLVRLEEQLNFLIPLLESSGIGVNVRYYPMCMIKEKYRRCVCNDLHVTFDPYEWDYNIIPKTNDAYLRWAKSGSKSVELKEYPCQNCDLQWICGGINKHFYHAMKYPEILKPIINSNIPDPSDFYFYRKNNILTLQKKESPNG